MLGRLTSTPGKLDQTLLALRGGQRYPHEAQRNCVAVAVRFSITATGDLQDAEAPSAWMSKIRLGNFHAR